MKRVWIVDDDEWEKLLKLAEDGLLKYDPTTLEMYKSNDALMSLRLIYDQMRRMQVQEDSYN